MGLKISMTLKITKMMKDRCLEHKKIDYIFCYNIFYYNKAKFENYINDDDDYIAVVRVLYM